MKLVSFSFKSNVYIVRVVPIKSITYPWESSQTTFHYMQNSFLLWYFKEWIFVSYPLADGTLHGSFLLEQRVRTKANDWRNDGCKAKLSSVSTNDVK